MKKLATILTGSSIPLLLAGISWLNESNQPPIHYAQDILIALGMVCIILALIMQIGSPNKDRGGKNE